MLDLTFGEQVKIVLSRKNMTIKELAEEIEKRTGKKMSRQYLTQRLGRDNFQEQDMRMIAGILGCPFRLDILEEGAGAERQERYEAVEAQAAEVLDEAPEDMVSIAENPEGREADEEDFSLERDITIGELVDINQELDEMIEEEQGEMPLQGPPVEELLEEMEEIEREAKERSQERINREERAEQERQARGWKAYLQRRKHRDTEDSVTEAEAVKAVAAGELVSYDMEAAEEPASEAEPENIQMPEESVSESNEIEEDLVMEEEEDLERGDVNPYTGREYKSNSVRMHPKRIGYVQVYDRGEHKWTDMTEWAFLGYQERKKALLGKDYEPPIYLD